MGNAIARSIAQPAKYTTNPQMKPTNGATRQRQFRAQASQNNTASETSTMTIPQTDGLRGIWRSLSRRAQIRYADNNGNQKAMGVVRIVLPLPDQSLTTSAHIKAATAAIRR